MRVGVLRGLALVWLEGLACVGFWALKRFDATRKHKGFHEKGYRIMDNGSVLFCLDFASSLV